MSDVHEDLKKFSHPLLDLGCGFNNLEEAEVKIDFVQQIGFGAPSVCNVMADGHWLPFKNETFGSINADNVFEHFQRPRDVVTECWRVLKESGLIRVVVPFGLEVLNIDIEQETAKLREDRLLRERYENHHWLSYRFGQPVLDIHVTNCDLASVPKWFSNWSLEHSQIEKGFGKYIYRKRLI